LFFALLYSTIVLSRLGEGNVSFGPYSILSKKVKFG
jgi:hypothetical protein